MLGSEIPRRRFIGLTVASVVTLAVVPSQAFAGVTPSLGEAMQNITDLVSVPIGTLGQFQIAYGDLEDRLNLDFP